MKNSATILAKIDKLFEGRRIADQFVQMMPSDAIHLLDQLRELQFKIYALDKYFEHTWVVRQHEIDLRWHGIYQVLGPLVPEAHNVEYLVKDIKAYQKLEESFRSPETFSLTSLRQLYHLKTCDVRLARRLIAQNSLDSQSEITDCLNSWELFDLISEVRDDLEDLSEDISTFNGNWILLSIGVRGLENTIAVYSKFVSEIADIIQKRQAGVFSKKSFLPFLEAQKNVVFVQDMLGFYNSQKSILLRMYNNSAIASMFDRSSSCNIKSLDSNKMTIFNTYPISPSM